MPAAIQSGESGLMWFARYNLSRLLMKAPLYAVVAYIRQPVGEFVEQLGRDLNPPHPELPAHITILPPRELQGTEAAASELITQICRTVEPFELVLGDVETFCPTTSTVFIRVAHAAYRMRELHDRLNSGALFYKEPWPYMPHLTIAKMSCDQDSLAAAQKARGEWAIYPGPKTIAIDQLTFVRQREILYSWEDLLPVRLGTKEELVGR
jgi:2'-5' RNA ligase